MRMGSLQTVIMLLSSAAFFVVTATALAQTKPDVAKDALEQLQASGESAGLRDKNTGDVEIRSAFAAGFSSLFAAYGMIFIVLMLVAGYKLITAHGEEDKIKTAYQIIIGAIIGLIIILSSYAIANFIGRKAVQVTDYGVSMLQILTRFV